MEAHVGYGEQLPCCWAGSDHQFNFRAMVMNRAKISVQKRKCAIAWTVPDIAQATFLVEDEG